MASKPFSITFSTLALVAILILVAGCSDLPTHREATSGWDETFLLSDYLPRLAELPEGLVLADHQISTLARVPQDYSKGAVERYSSQWGWGIFTRVSERLFVGDAVGRDDRNFEEPRVVVYIYRRRPGFWIQTESVVTVEGGCQSRIEGIGRARVEPSFEPGVIDRMIAVHDADSLGAMFALSKTLGRKVGGSTGTNLFACLQLIEEMASAGQSGSIVSLLCDDGARYASTYYSEEWLAEWGGDWRPAYNRMLEILE